MGPQLLQREKVHAKLRLYKTGLLQNQVMFEGYIMLVQQLKECIIKESIYFIYNNQTENGVFQPSENFCFEGLFSGLTIVVGLVIDTRERLTY